MTSTYRIPSMGEIAGVPTSGVRVVSLFSGCGGGCLGLEMTGAKVLLASEFVEEARRTYEANHPGVPVLAGDIRETSVDDVLSAAELAPGELDLLEGSPPCSSFSTAGKRSAKWGEVSDYSDTRQRTDDLFYEFVRILDGVRPRAFVAENVSGLVKGVSKGYYLRILASLRAAGYVVGARILDASWLGVPQARHRLIIVGFRDDLGLVPSFPAPLDRFYSFADAVAGLPDPVGMIDPETGESIALGNAIGREWDRLRVGEQSSRYFQLVRPALDRPVGTITAAGGNVGLASVVHPTERRKFTLAELRRLCGFPDDFILTGSYAQRWERLGRAVPPPMMAAVGVEITRSLRG